LADIARQTQGLRTADVAALESAGQAQQRQAQAEIDANRLKFEQEQMYPRQQLDWLSTQIRGMAPITPAPTTQAGQTTGATYSPSPLSQLATGIYTYKGLSSI
jgi:Lon protease-like protein